MNSSKRHVKLIVISDFICPWCYIGYRQLQDALAQCSDLPLKFELEYRPFIVCPTLTDEGGDKAEHLLKKFGKQKLDVVNHIASTKGEEIGINFSFQGRISQSTRAHRLMMKAWQVGGSPVQLDLLRSIFKAYHEEEQNLADIEMLAELAEGANVMSKNEAVEFLKSDELLEDVEEQIAEARAKGVTGVPFTIIDGKWAVSGGETAAVYVKIFKKLASAECMGSCQSSPSTPIASTHVTASA